MTDEKTTRDKISTEEQMPAKVAGRTESSKDGDQLPEWYEEMSKGRIAFSPGVLARHLADTENLICVEGQNYIYHNGVYVKVSEVGVRRIVKEHMLDEEARITEINDAEKQLELLVQKDVSELNAEPFLINLRNGIYDIKADTLREHTPDLLSTIQLPVNYDKNADCPLFKQFLNETMQGDISQVGLIQEMMGYSLIPGNRAQKAFVLVGAPAGGKTVLIRVLSEVLVGKENVSNVPWQSLNERFKGAELFGKLLNVFADLPTKNIDDNGIFKTLIGEDYITVERKYQHPFSFQNKAKLIFSCNTIPQNYGDKSEGFYRRLIIIPFGRTVPEEERDPELVDKLSAEADGIFNFALKGLCRLIDNQYKFSTTQVNETALQEYRESSNSALAFVNERCDVDTDMCTFTGSQELYNAYTAFCEDSGQKPYALNKFISQIVIEFDLERGKDSVGSRRGLKGIKLKEDFD